MTTRPDTRRYTALALLLLAAVGLSGLAAPACSYDRWQRYDTDQDGILTPQEIAPALAPGQDAVNLILTTSGQPQYVPIADALARLAAVLVAFFIRPKDATTAKTPPPSPQE